MKAIILIYLRCSLYSFSHIELQGRVIVGHIVHNVYACIKFKFQSPASPHNRVQNGRALLGPSSPARSPLACTLPKTWRPATGQRKWYGLDRTQDCIRLEDGQRLPSQAAPPSPPDGSSVSLPNEPSRSEQEVPWITNAWLCPRACSNLASYLTQQSAVSIISTCGMQKRALSLFCTDISEISQVQQCWLGCTLREDSVHCSICRPIFSANVYIIWVCII